MQSLRNLTKRNFLRRGFSIVELVVAIAIMLVLSSVTLFNYNKINQHLALETLAHQIAQWVREAQVSSMSVKRTRADSTKFPGYGIHFDRSVPNGFVFFADTDDGAGGLPDRRYEAPVAPAKCGGITECEQSIALMQGNKIEKLCGESSSVSAEGGDCGLLDHADDMDIVFTRPDGEATIIGHYSPGNLTTYSHAQITVISPFKERRVIDVWPTGQISVQ